MSIRRIVGVVLMAIGIIALARGGIFWTEREKVLDVGPVEVTTEEREGFPVPTAVGIISLIGGVVLLVAPSRRRT